MDVQSEVAMRVLQDENGEFYIDDEPMRISGPDAERILAEMDKPATPEQLRRMKECLELYERNIAPLFEKKLADDLAKLDP